MASIYLRNAAELTARERDCLRLLGRGLSTTEVAADLGIKKSTLESHLASARRKLGVTTTRQAVAATIMSVSDVVDRQEQLDRVREVDHASDFLDVLESASTLDDAWAMLCRHVRSFGVGAVNFGLVADPLCNATRQNSYFRSSLPQEVVELYEGCGGVVTDPNIRRYATTSVPFLVTSRMLQSQFADMPPAVRALATSLLDQRMATSLCVPLRDEATGAVQGTAFVFEEREATMTDAAMRSIGRHLESASIQFATVIRSRRFLAASTGMHEREVESLRLLVRGFSTAQAADRLGVSLRGYEKMLAAVRSKLGARTNAQAVYRATVYRAL